MPEMKFGDLSPGTRFMWDNVAYMVLAGERHEAACLTCGHVWHFNVNMTFDLSKSPPPCPAHEDASDENE